MQKQEIYLAINEAIKKSKKSHPLPDHICGRVGLVTAQSGNAMTFALEAKYNGTIEASTKNLKDALITGIAESFRILEQM